MSRSFDIGRKRIGDGQPVFLIAELSANHGGSLEVARRTIEAAAKAGADAIKLQTYTPDTLTLKSSAPPFIVRTQNAWNGRTLYDLYAEAMTPWEWHERLKETATAVSLEFFSTPFDPTATQYLEALDVPAHKIASFEIVDLPLIEHVARRAKPVIISTGMASLGEIEAAINTCRGVGNDRIVLLRCVSSYPADPSEMNLQSFAALRAFGTLLGLSDHTRGETVAVAAVALGAKVIEKHFTLDRTLGGPDAFFSLEPAEFRSMADAVRACESALGPASFGPSPGESASIAFRRSLFVARDVTAGDVLTCDDIRSVRPSYGLAPRHLPEVLGRVAARDLHAGTPLTWDAIGMSLDPSVELRPATSDDAARLLAWRNDPLSRAMSLVHDEVGQAEHADWLAHSLASPHRDLRVAWQGPTPVGQVRLDAEGHGSWRISITVAPEARGKRLAAELLRAAEQVARTRAASRLLATIRREHDRSIRAFKAAGYYAFVERIAEDGMYTECERRLVPYT